MRAVDLEQLNTDWHSSVGSGHFAVAFKAKLKGRADEVVVKLLREERRISEEHRYV